MITKEKNLLFLLLSLSVSMECAFSQQIPFESLTMRDGLSSYYVTDITQDKSGFLWFATKHGVSRFNGSKFTLYYKDTSGEALNSNEISAIKADTIHNKVWIAHRWNGINVFDGVSETFSSYKHDKNKHNSLISNEILDICISSTGDVWMATAKGLQLYDAANDGFTHFNNTTVKGFPDDVVLTLSEGPNGEIYLGHLQHGFSIFNPFTQEIKNYKHATTGKNTLPDNTVNAIHAGPPSKVWLATNSGLSQFDWATEKFQNFRDIGDIHPTIKKRVLHVFQDKNGRVWAGTESDLCYFDIHDFEEIVAEKKDVNHMFIQDIYQGISNPTVLVVFEDAFGNIWIGSNGAAPVLLPTNPRFLTAGPSTKSPAQLTD